MTTITVECNLDISIEASQVEIYRFFSSPSEINLCTGNVKDFKQLSANKATWILEEKNDLGIRFCPQYTLCYKGDKKCYVEWRSESGTLDIHGSVNIVDNQANCRVEFSESVTFELPISKTMGLLAKTVAKHEVVLENKHYLERVKERLESIVVM